ncbi:helix-turn-helix transcriptional regulator [Methyloceanibacter stevinii]|uniref:helix-turn-helix domain-containing protein n=1 Tax=Methyloceanibacter stevinii TaxID=1774970 RepID=UPI0009F52733
MAALTGLCKTNSDATDAASDALGRADAPPSVPSTQNLPRQADVIDRLVQLLKVELPYGPVAIAYAAAQLHTSVRTLQRRLAATGLRFTDLVDEIRRSAAVELVLADALTGAQIAHMLGYSDQSHFTRAFKRWTGTSPRQYVARRPSLRQRETSSRDCGYPC